MACQPPNARWLPYNTVRSRKKPCSTINSGMMPSSCLIVLTAVLFDKPWPEALHNHCGCLRLNGKQRRSVEIWPMNAFCHRVDPLHSVLGGGAFLPRRAEQHSTSCHHCRAGYPMCNNQDSTVVTRTVPRPAKILPECSTQRQMQRNPTSSVVVVRGWG